jgi:hypothetical protein
MNKFVTGEAIAVLAVRIGVRAACAASAWRRRPGTGGTGLPRHRRAGRRCRTATWCSRVHCPWRNGPRILGVPHADRFADTAPAEVWATLLDEGIYLGSLSTAALAARFSTPGYLFRTRATYTGGVDGWIDDIIAQTRKANNPGRCQPSVPGRTESSSAHAAGSRLLSRWTRRAVGHVRPERGLLLHSSPSFSHGLLTSERTAWI